MNGKLRPDLLCIVVLLASGIAGCSSADRATVSGTVLLSDGSPLVGARVIVQPKSGGKTAYATTDNEGHFVLDTGNEGTGTVPGEYQVTVIEDTGRGDREARTSRKLSLKYSQTETSGLTFTVAAGEQKQLELKLEGP